MSMKFNGTELSDVYFNGTQLDKVYFNGILVFEKVKGYFRRIMVGDVMPAFDTELMSDFPSGYYNNINTTEDFIFFDYSDPDQNTYNRSSTFKTLSDSSYKAVYSPSYVTWYGDTGFYEYNIATGEEHTLTDIDNPVYDLKITGIKDNEAYRHIYVKDENIRPIQVGDDLSGATLYFVFPDNLIQELINISENSDSCYGVIGRGEEYTAPSYQYSEGYITPYIEYWIWPDGDEKIFQIVLYWRNGSMYNGDLYFNDDSGSNEYLINISKINLPIDWGEVSEDAYEIIEGPAGIGQEIYNCIYVDTQTLNNTSHVRRVQVGDNLKNRYLYGDYPHSIEHEFTTQSNIIDTNYRFHVDCSVSSSFIIVSVKEDISANETFGEGELFRFNNNDAEDCSGHGGEYIDAEEDCIVTSIKDSAAYRGIYIEDPNLRPLQVGDIILPGTRFYFNFLDTSYNYIDDWMEMFIASYGEDDRTSVLSLDLNVDDLNSPDRYTISWWTEDSNWSDPIYDFSVASGTVQTNQSTGKVPTGAVPSTGVYVLDVDTINYPEISSRILVDDRTLVNSNFRHLQNGDILQEGTILKFTFPDTFVSDNYIAGNYQINTLAMIEGDTGTGWINYEIDYSPTALDNNHVLKVDYEDVNGNRTEFYSYSSKNLTDAPIINEAFLVLNSSSQYGIVKSLKTTAIPYEHIWVDTTTLG